MHQAPKTERVELYKWQHAFSSMNEASGILKQINDSGVTHEHPLHHALWAAFHVFYAKPFKQHKVIRIDEDIVPKDFANEHKAIITLRDKLFAHSDLDGPNMNDGELVNSINFSFHPENTQSMVFGIRYGFPAPEAINRYDELILELMQIFHNESARIFNSWIPYLDVDPLKIYKVNIGDGSNDVLKE